MVEAGVRFREELLVAVFLLQIEDKFAEAADGGAVAAGGELEEEALLHLVELLEDLEEPLDELVVLAEPAPELASVEQVLEVEQFGADDQLLELLRFEEGSDGLKGGGLVEAALEGLELGLAAGVEGVLDEELDVLLGGLLGDLDGAAAGLELLDDLLAEALGLEGEVEVEDFGKGGVGVGVVEDELHGLADLGLPLLEVLERGLLADE